MRAAIYTRESKGNAESVLRQREDALQLAAQRGYEVAEILGDKDTSAAGKRARPDFDRLLSLARSGRVGAFVAWSWDRLERNRRDTLRIVEACQEHGVVIALVRGSDVDMSSPAGRMTADILASVARHEIEQRADRMNRAQRQAAEAGKPPSRRAFGYLRDGTIDPVEARAVMWAFQALLGGASIGHIARSINEMGLLTTTGRAWSTAAVRKLLMNPRYCAVRTFQGREIGPGQWKPIVSEDVFRAVGAVLADPSRRTVETHARKWLGANLYLCGICGSTVRSGYKVYPTKDGQKRVRVYLCRAKSHLARRADVIDEHVEAEIVRELRTIDIGRLMSSRETGNVDVSALRSEAQALRKRRETLAADLSVDEAMMVVRDRALAERLSAVESALAEAGSRSALAAISSEPDPGDAFLAHGDVSVRQEIVRELYTVVLLPGKPGKAFDKSTVRLFPTWIDLFIEGEGVGPLAQRVADRLS